MKGYTTTGVVFFHAAFLHQDEGAAVWRRPGREVVRVVCVNGRDMEIESGKVLKDFLLEQGFTIGRIAVECNGEIVPKAVYDKHLLKDGDKLEVVNFVGGG